MKDTDSMTMQDVLEMMKCIREFFTVVRLESGYDTMDSEETYCEIEYLKEDIFFVKAKRIEIDGKPYVVKIKQEVDEKILQALLETDQIPELVKPFRLAAFCSRASISSLLDLFFSA